eukprot:TRINITY_DN14472_c0_g1_i1.p1 TRINITY_DN14472_c0_g1~~TRINITY_DN14472_c0_g1_i1.p1  ORF type:complete len:801 (+),score=180.96 TRINITY_DN14472_c0_g1_i1:327-2405(+)
MQQRVEAYKLATAHRAMSVPRLQHLHSSVYEQLDRFADTDLMEDVKLPEANIVVLGEENVGKSTVLERLVGFPVFPRERGLCTKMAVALTLRRGPAQLAHLSVSPPWSACPPVRVPLDTVSDELKRMMDACVAGREYDRRVLKVQVVLPYAPCLTVVDIPGVVNTEPGASITRDIAKVYLNYPSISKNALYILVATSLAALRTSTASQLVTDYSVQDRTLGILTNIDRLVPQDDGGSPAEELALKLREAQQLTPQPAGRGWLALANVSNPKLVAKASEGRREVFRLHHMNAKEREVLARLQAELDDETNLPILTESEVACMGIDAARQRVQHFFEQHVQHHWLGVIRERLKARFELALARTVALGIPVTAEPEYDSPLEIVRNHLPEKAVPLFPPGGSGDAGGNAEGIMAAAQVALRKALSTCNEYVADEHEAHIAALDEAHAYLSTEGLDVASVQRVREQIANIKKAQAALVAGLAARRDAVVAGVVAGAFGDGAARSVLEELGEVGEWEHLLGTRYDLIYKLEAGSNLRQKVVGVTEARWAAAIPNLGRFPQIRVALTAHLTASATAGEAKFREAVDAACPPNTPASRHAYYDPALGKIVKSVPLLSAAELVALWTELVLCSLVDNVPSIDGRLPQESVKNDRLTQLWHMAKCAEALDALAAQERGSASDRDTPPRRVIGLQQRPRDPVH